MKILSCDGSRLLKHVSISAKEEQLHDMLDGLCKTCTPPVVQLKSSSGQTFFVKFLPPNSQEAEILEILRANLPTQHLVEFAKRAGNLVFVVGIPPLAPQVKTLKDLLHLDRLRNIQVKVLQSVLAQIAAFLVLAQRFDPTFAHNDLKADNVLLTRHEASDPLEIGEWRIQHQGVKVVIIDVETVTGSNFPSLHLEDISQEAQVEFGLSKDTPFCEWTDMHLVLMEVWMRCRAKPPPWFHEFQTFLGECMPLAAFLTFEQGNKRMLTSCNRLSIKGRNAINILMERKEALHLTDALQLPFLSSVCEKKSAE